MKVSLGQGENPRVKGFFIAAPGGGNYNGSALDLPGGLLPGHGLSAC